MLTPLRSVIVTLLNTRLLVLIDPRRKWHLVLDGRRDWFAVPWGLIPPVRDGLPSRASIESTLALDSGVRITRYLADDAARTVNEHEVGLGFVDSQIKVELQENPGDVTLTVSGGRGRMHVRDHKLTVTGESHYNEKFLRAALRDGLPTELKRGPFFLGFGPYRVSPDGVLSLIHI